MPIKYSVLIVSEPGMGLLRDCEILAKLRLKLYSRCAMLWNMPDCARNVICPRSVPSLSTDTTPASNIVLSNSSLCPPNIRYLYGKVWEAKGKVNHFYPKSLVKHTLCFMETNLVVPQSMIDRSTIRICMFKCFNHSSPCNCMQRQQGQNLISVECWWLVTMFQMMSLSSCW